MSAKIGCSELKCDMSVSTKIDEVSDGDLVDFSFVLLAKSDATLNIFEDSLCNVSFDAPSNPNRLLTSSRYCSRYSWFLPSQKYSYSGAGDRKQLSYAISSYRSIRIGPNSNIEFTLSGTASISEDGVASVVFAEDVYFHFQDGDVIVVKFGLPTDNLQESEDRYFFSYLRGSVFQRDSGPVIVRLLPIESPKAN